MMPELTVEHIEALQLGYFTNFVNENDLTGDLKKWLKVHGYEKEDGKLRTVLKEFIVDYNLKNLFRKWLILTFREDNDDDVTPDEITKFIEMFEIK